jgi:hypothetical protein
MYIIPEFDDIAKFFCNPPKSGAFGGAFELGLVLRLFYTARVTVWGIAEDIFGIF